MSTTTASNKPDHYTSSYAGASIHFEMLGDYIRTATYRSALVDHPEYLKDAVVLDLGAGTGVLSMFAVQAGARHVVALEMSDIADTAREIIDRNGFSNKITLVKAKSEEADLLAALAPAMERDPELRAACTDAETGEFRCDVIISEWQGYGLVYESMMDSVIEARDRWLRPNGLVLPARCELFVALYEDDYGYDRDHVQRSHMYGLDFTPLVDLDARGAGVDYFAPEAVITKPLLIKKWDMHNATIEDFATFGADDMESNKLEPLRAGTAHGLVLWFDVVFYDVGHTGKERIIAPEHEDEFAQAPVTGRLVLSTSPLTPYTHWQQVYFTFQKPVPICAGTPLELVEFTARRNTEYHRAYVFGAKIKNGEEVITFEKPLD